IQGQTGRLGRNRRPWVDGAPRQGRLPSRSARVLLLVRNSLQGSTSPVFPTARIWPPHPRRAAPDRQGSFYCLRLTDQRRSWWQQANMDARSSIMESSLEGGLATLPYHETS
ncbi:unnamed protein product, partial [Nesidiocoris tenuis]